jgi:hypothetical protein
LKIKTDAFPNFELKEFQKILLVRVSRQYKEAWASKIIESLYNNDAFDSVVYAKIIDELDAIDRENSFRIDAFKKLKTKNISVDKFIALVKDKTNKYSNYKIVAEKSDLDKYFSELEIDNLRDIDYITNLTTGYEFTLFKKTLKEKINLNKANKANLSTLFNALKYVSKNTIGVLLTDNEIYNLFTRSDINEDFYYDLIAMRLARGISFAQPYQPYFSTILNTDDGSTIEKVAKQIEYYITYGDFLLNSISFPDSHLYKAVVRQIVENNYMINRANVRDLLLEFEAICNTNELDSQIFITDLSGWKSPEFDDEFIQSIPNFYYEEVLKNDSRLAKDSISSVVSYFDNFTQEKWRKVFEDLQSKDYKLLEIIGYNKWNSFALEALKEDLLSIARTGKIENNAILTRLIENFEEVGKDLVNTFKDIRDEFIKNGNNNVYLFLFFGKWLFKYASLQEKASDVLRTILKTNLLDNDDCVKILIDSQSIVKNIVDSCSQNESSDFKEGVRDRIENEQISELAISLGIKERKEKE